MGNRPVNGFLHNLRISLRARTTEAKDAELLEQFLTRRSESAFESLVWRHGPVVLGVCRRVLASVQDVEDAFQATFLVLARKGASIGRREALAAWLYQTAYRVALRARTITSRHPPHHPLPDDLAGVEPSDVQGREVQPLLDEEILRLPRKYRVPIVLCYFEGLTTEEAARRLQCPRGTVNSRLAWARQRLRARLTRRGVSLSVGLAGLLSADAAAAPVSSELAASTVRTALWITTSKGLAADTTCGPAVNLMEGVLHTMWSAKIRLLVLVLVTAGALAGGAGLLARRVLGAGPFMEAAAAEPPRQPATEPPGPAKPVRSAPEPEAAAQQRKLEEEKLRQLKERYERLQSHAEEAVHDLRRQLEDIEKQNLRTRIEFRIIVAEAAEALRLAERRVASQREAEEAEVKFLQQGMDRLRADRTAEDKLREAETRLKDILDRNQAREANRSKEAAVLRKQHIVAEEELDMVRRNEQRQRDRIQERLKAAETRLDQISAKVAEVTTERPGSDLQEMLDRVLRELAELRSELRQRR